MLKVFKKFDAKAHDLTIRADLDLPIVLSTKKIKIFTSITHISRSTITTKATRSIHTGSSIEARIGRRALIQRLSRAHFNIKEESRPRVDIGDGASS